MIKAVFLLKRKDGMSLQDFADWLLKDHVPLALKLDGLKRYQVTLAREADGDYDGVSELWVDSEDAMLAADAGAPGQAGAHDSPAHAKTPQPLRGPDVPAPPTDRHPTPDT